MTERAGSRSRLVTALLAVPATLAFLIALGTFLPIPVLDIVGALVSSVFVWSSVACCVLVAAVWWAWRRRRTTLRSVLLGMSALAALGSLVVGGRVTVFAVDQGLPIDVGQVLVGAHLSSAPDETVTYLHHRGAAVTLSVWEPERAARAAPVIVMTHGGGFTAGSVTTGVSPAHARWFADHGYLVVGADYTLATATDHTWDVAEGQLACALAWTGTHAGAFHGDASRLAMFGDSAGGNLAVNVAYKANAGTLASACGGQVPKVDAVSGIYPAVGTIESYENTDVLGIAGRRFLGDYHGGSPEQVPERYAATESRNAVSPAAPPTLVVFGAADHLVPARGTERFVSAARKAHVPVEAIAIPFGEHGFDAVNTGGIGAQVWRLATLDWFRTHAAG